MKGLSVVAAVVLVVLMIHSWRGSSTDFSRAVTCYPDCTDVSDGDRVVNPRNCSEYYYCLDQAPSGHALPCDPGTHFDTASQTCIAGTECEPLCRLWCPLTCDESLSVIGDAFDCSVYYSCSPDGASDPQYCPSDRPIFDGTDCVADQELCCSGYCIPFCDGSGITQVPDPNDCTNFYICGNEEEIPDESVHFSCIDGEYFNIQNGQCESGIPDPCPALCDAARGRQLGHLHHHHH